MNIEEILTNFKVIAVVGASDDPKRHSYLVFKYLKEHGYRVTPVNPHCKQIIGETCFPDLLSIPTAVEVVDIFRKSEDVPPIVQDAIRKGAKVIWMQEGIINEAAASMAREAGLEIIMDECMMKKHILLIGHEF